RFAELDTDENGAISESELTAAVIRQFSCMDADWDGAVTLEEARAALPPQRSE
ncbi:MAG TPA: EF-hand domain-containing protein, partial [Kiloniellaceae bacterium]|nr:EF-hand domain-containing protein [Kiloniellaceae bacterium]